MTIRVLKRSTPDDGAKYREPKDRFLLLIEATGCGSVWLGFSGKVYLP
jgi:hypothetical protein